MDSWRIRVQLQDKSASVGAFTSAGMGATVIPASRGPNYPVKINTGETERMRQLFGANRYEVLEAMAYNTKYPLYVVAPHSGGTFSAMLLTDKGLLPIPLSFSGNPDTLNFSKLPMQFKAGVSDGAAAEFTLSFPANIFPKGPSLKTFVPNVSLVVGGVPSVATCVWNEAISGYDIAIVGSGSGTILPSSERVTIDWLFDAGTIPPKGTLVSIKVSTDATDLEGQVYAIVGMRYPCEDYLAAAVYKSENEGTLMLDLQQKKKGVYSAMSNYPREISIVPGTVNASGVLIYAPALLANDDNIFVKVQEDEPMTWETWSGESEDLVNFEYGHRGAKITGIDLADGWNEFKKFKKYPADIYFDTTADPAVPSAMTALRAGPIKYKRFLYAQPMITASEVLENIPLSVSDRGLATFWGAAFIQNIYEPTGDLLSTLMGEIAAKYADALVFSYGGRAVAWSDENQVGGQLSMGRIVKFLYDADETELKALDKGRINPVGPNELFGPIVMSRRSTDKSAGNYSYADYSAIVDYCVERIVNEVLPYQLVKFNDDGHRALVRGKAELILSPLMVAPNNVIRDYAIKCDSENNGDDVLAREEFILTVAIKVTPKSEVIIFNFVNSAQTGSVMEDVK